MKRIVLCFGFRTPVPLACGALLVLTVSSEADSTLIASTAQSTSATVAAARAETGIASYYGSKYHGKATASGEAFDMNDFTAAHPKLAFGTKVKVTHLGNDRTVIVRINDRGPFLKGRIIDLSQAAAVALQMDKQGTAQVKVEVIE